MTKINILLLCGGDGSEHSVSLVSAKYLKQQLQTIPQFEVISAVLHQKHFVLEDGSCAAFDQDGQLNTAAGKIKIDTVIPCIHGFPGETGDIQSYFEVLGIPYIGCGSEASRNCFNKITTKLYLTALGIPNTPYIFLSSPDRSEIDKAGAAFNAWHDVYVKAACEGSSVGCYHVTDFNELHDAICEAFSYSQQVLIEKTIPHRELEVAAYEMDRGLVITDPGEIIMPSNAFYTYDEKYSKDSRTTTTVTPRDLSPKALNRIHELAERAFKGLKLRDLSRIDFFLCQDGEVLINEINTFPGMTPISMFPKLLEHHGDTMPQFLAQAIARARA